MTSDGISAKTTQTKLEALQHNDVETLQHQNNTGGFSLQCVSESCHRLVILGMITNI